MLKQLLSKKDQSGFTIIEVMIVMALAGLILAAVIVAVPQLQRNQRNTARKDIVSRIKAEIDSYSGNNNGNIPAASSTAVGTNFGSPSVTPSFFARYLGCTAPGGAATCTVNINDPQSGTPVGATGGGVSMTTTYAGVPGLAAGSLPGSINYASSTVCNGEVSVAVATVRNYSLQIQLEGGAIYCLDNR
jgi:prepilin-type N-terminal cleavage/methylation domain-containing protein